MALGNAKDYRGAAISRRVNQVNKPPSGNADNESTHFDGRKNTRAGKYVSDKPDVDTTERIWRDKRGS